MSGYTYKLVQDKHPESPEFWDNDYAFLVGLNGRHFWVGTKTQRAILETELDRKKKAREYHLFPLYAYIHSGVSLALGRNNYPFTCPWDTCQVGWVLLKKGAGWRNLRKTAEAVVDEWNQYLSGDVWGYIVEETATGEEVDSLWGIYGHEEAKARAEEAVRHMPLPEPDPISLVVGAA